MWELPTTVQIGEEQYNIRYDFRAILDIFHYLNDPEYTDDERWEIALRIFYPEFDKIPPCLFEECAKKFKEFVDMGMPQEEAEQPVLMNWEQDAPILIPAINNVLGYEIRGVKELHWWTFTGAYMTIGESLFSQVVQIRSKKAKGKKLEKHEQEFYNENKHLINLEKKLTLEEEQEKQALLKLLGDK